MCGSMEETYVLHTIRFCVLELVRQKEGSLAGLDLNRLPNCVRLCTIS